MAVVLAIDFGTSGCRSALYDEQLSMLDCATEEYPIICVSDKEIEQDADVWWEKAKKTIKEVVGRYSKPEEISAISLSSQGIGLVPIDENGRTLSNSISWLDTRCVEETKYIENTFGKSDIYRITGKRISPLYSLPKLMWIKKHCSEIYSKAWKFLLPMDFIQYRLSGKCITDYTMASGTMYYDVASQSWSEKLLKENGLSSDKLSEIMWAGEPIGTIIPEVADELGLSSKVLIVNGAQDQKCAAHGAGVSDKCAAVSLGTGSVVSQISNHSMVDSEMRIPFFSYIEPNTWNLEGVINTSGSAYSWFSKEFGAGMSYDEINEAASSIILPNQTMFYPYLSGPSSPFWNEGSGTFTGISLMTTKGNLARAIMEGIAYSIRENLDAMEKISNKVTELHVYGGGSKSSLWCQIIADVNNTDVVCLSSSETALAGAARLAYKALGIKTSPLSESKRYKPDKKSVEMYQKSYEKYEELRIRFFAS